MAGKITETTGKLSTGKVDEFIKFEPYEFDEDELEAAAEESGGKPKKSLWLTGRWYPK